MAEHDLIRYGFDDISRPGDREAYAREQALLMRYNDPQTSWDERHTLLRELVECGEDSNVIAPFFVARGDRVRLGRKVFINGGVLISGGAQVEIGDYTLIAPSAQLHTVTHPVDPTERQRWAFWAKPIRIGQNVWIGAGAIICPGVSIGDHSVIGAGSVVTHDVPACVLAAGNPCQVVRQLDPPDMSTLYELRERT
ncbi:sugar O-acetyltransferase [Chitiniphilus purpureus]|uniref:Sugar O-acetyltransferase n=1 Tax=Chitiniphilus purpureus TaxID=2981137 RepID=A0ABY6DV25_9NEIS|nr:sugar O-acetyltransferase [Chitiniphilus sp. CD1]UXY15718.1 sugar O-acetyltransferase [Chitiniphilus sp. CD1]